MHLDKAATFLSSVLFSFTSISGKSINFFGQRIVTLDLTSLNVCEDEYVIKFCYFLDRLGTVSHILKNSHDLAGFHAKTIQATVTLATFCRCEVNIWSIRDCHGFQAINTLWISYEFPRFAFYSDSISF